MIKVDKSSNDVEIVEGKMTTPGHGNIHFEDVCNPVRPCSITLPANNGDPIMANLQLKV